MAALKQLSRLFQAIAAQDVGRAREIGVEIASSEEQKGHHSAAQLLRGALHANGHRPVASSAHQQPMLLSDALSPVREVVSLSDVRMRSQQLQEVKSLLKEWRRRARITAKGITRRSKLFFYGEPGCGKSYCAKAIGQELGLPTYIVRFDAVIGAYLGQTAVHLRELFNFAETNDCVLLLDEIDALGRRRGNPLDVGELDRIVIAMLQELEHSTPRGFIIATSNLPRHIDDALWRRFDLVVEFSQPNKTELLDYGEKIAKKFHVKLSPAAKRRIQSVKSFAEAKKMVEAEARQFVLRGR